MDSTTNSGCTYGISEELQSLKEKVAKLEVTCAARLKAIDMTHKNRVMWRERAQRAEEEIERITQKPWRQLKC